MREMWSARLIQDICLVTDYVANGSFASLRENVKSVDEPDYAVLVRMTDFTKGWNGKYKYVNEAAYNFLNKSSLGPNDLIMCNVGDPGKAFLLPDLGLPMTLGPNSILIRADDNVTSNKFLYYYFESNIGKAQIASITAGAAQKKFNKTSFRSLSIKLPPIAEQKRIVTILDEAFAGIDTAIANTEKNLANARELFESYLKSVFTEQGKEWPSKRLGDLTEVQSGGTPLKSKKEYWDGEIAWYSSGELNELHTKEPANQITELGLNNSNAKLFPSGSLLIGMYDTAALKMSILDRDAAFNQAIAGAKPNSDIDLIFIRYAINAEKPEILSQRRGVRQKNLSLGKIKDIVIPMPDITKQRNIVDELSGLIDQVQRLENIYRQKLDSLKELKQSLLQKAFTGELTTENNKLMGEAVA